MMRELTLTEANCVTGAAFIEGLIADDFAFWGAAIGLSCSYILGDIAATRYNNAQGITWTDKVRCTFWTAFEGAKYGVLIDAAWYAASMGLNLIKQNV